MPNEIVRTRLPGDWEHVGTRKRGNRGDKVVSTYENMSVGSSMKIGFGWSPNYHHCYIHYTDSEGRFFGESWGGNDEPGLSKDELSMFSLGVMMGAEGSTPSDFDYMLGDGNKELVYEGVDLFREGNEWENADVPISKVGIELRSEFTVREPTPDEWMMYVEWYEDTFGMTRNETVRALQSAFIVMIDGYQSDSPGYAGDILFAVHGYPSAHYMLIEDRDWDTGETLGFKEVDKVGE